MTSIDSYTVPATLARSPDYRAFVHDTEIPVIHAAGGDFVRLPASGPVDIEIQMAAPYEEACVRPSRHKIVPTLSQQRVAIHLPGAGHYCLELDRNTSARNPLFIFLDRADIAEPRGARVFGPGIHQVDDLWLSSGDSIHLAPGAVIHGCFRARGARGISITGPGMIDGGFYEPHQRQLIQFADCHDVTLEGFTIKDSPSWTTVLLGCQHVRIEGLRIINNGASDDGIDICGSSHVSVKNCFVRAKDDCIAIKSVHYPKFHIGSGISPVVEDIEISGCVFWGGLWGNCVEIGFETQADCIRDIRVADCDILHQESAGSVFSIHNGDRAHVQHVSVSRLRCERVAGTLVGIHVVDDIYRVDQQAGRVSDVTISDCCVFAGCLPCNEIEGGSAQTPVENVRIHNLFLRGSYLKKSGVKAQDAYDARLIHKHATGISITHDGSEPEVFDECVVALHPPGECFWR